jgi:hypothetical protein
MAGTAGGPAEASTRLTGGIMKWDPVWIASIAAAASALFALVAGVFQIKSTKAAGRSATAADRSANAAEQANQFEAQRRKEEIEAAERRKLEAQFEVTAQQDAGSPPGEQNYMLKFHKTGPSGADEVEYRVNSLGPDGWGTDAKWDDHTMTFNPDEHGQTRPVTLPSNLTRFKVDIRWKDNARMDLRGFATFNFDRDGQPAKV